jgi:hypothetical protein
MLFSSKKALLLNCFFTLINLCAVFGWDFVGKFSPETESCKIDPWLLRKTGPVGSEGH